MDNTPKISARHVDVYYGAKKAIDDVSIDIDSGIVTAFIGVAFIAAAIQGWLIGAGRLDGTPLRLLARVMLAAGGIALAAPGGNLIPVSNTTLAVIGAALALGASLLLKFGKHDTLNA